MESREDEDCNPEKRDFLAGISQRTITIGLIFFMFGLIGFALIPLFPEHAGIQPIEWIVAGCATISIIGLTHRLFNINHSSVWKYSYLFAAVTTGITSLAVTIESLVAGLHGDNLLSLVVGLVLLFGTIISTGIYLKYRDEPESSSIN